MSGRSGCRNSLQRDQCQANARQYAGVISLALSSAEADAHETRGGSTVYPCPTRDTQTPNDNDVIGPSTTAQDGDTTGSLTGAAGLQESPQTAGTLRRLLLAILVFGMVGVTVELLLLGHTDEFWQWTPIVALGLGIVAGIGAGVRPSPVSLRLFRGLMALFIAAGLAGLYLHYHGNTEFELEMYPSIKGFALFWKSITGATPALAPGTMIQFGLLGLALTWKHPNLRRVRSFATTPRVKEEH